MRRSTQAELFRRNRVTANLLSQLEDALRHNNNGMIEILVGDSIAPHDGGWPEGNPESGPFVPYVVLRTGSAGPWGPPDIGQSEARAWKLGYTLRAVGSTRGQSDWVADQARAGWSHLVLDGVVIDGWKMRSADVESIGPVERNDSADPHTWETLDQMSLVLTS